MKTLKQNKLFSIFFSIFMALCAVLGILSTVPRLASADEAGFDWSKYDDPAKCVETVLTDGDEVTLQNKVIRIKCSNVENGTNIQFDFVDGSLFIIKLGQLPKNGEMSLQEPQLTMDATALDSNFSSLCFLTVEQPGGGIFYRKTDEYVDIYISNNAYFYEKNWTQSAGEILPGTDTSNFIKREIPAEACCFKGEVLERIAVNSGQTIEDIACTVSVLELNEQNNPGTGSGGSSINGNDTKPESAEKMDVTEIVFLVGLAFGELILLTLCAMKLPRSGKWFTLLVLLLIFVGFDLILYMNFIGMI